MNFKIMFDPKFIEEFDGTQEELDQLVESIKNDVRQAIESGELDDYELVDFDEFLEATGEEPVQKRTLH